MLLSPAPPPVHHQHDDNGFDDDEEGMAPSPLSMASSTDSAPLYSGVTVPFDVRVPGGKVETVQVTLDQDADRLAQDFAAAHALGAGLQEALAKQFRVRQLEMAKEIIKGLDQDARAALKAHATLLEEKGARQEEAAHEAAQEEQGRQEEALEAELGRRLDRIILLEEQALVSTAEAQQAVAQLARQLQDSEAARGELTKELSRKETEVHRLEVQVASQNGELKGLEEVLRRSKLLKSEMRALERRLREQKSNNDDKEEEEEKQGRHEQYSRRRSEGQQHESSRPKHAPPPPPPAAAVASPTPPRAMPTPPAAAGSPSTPVLPQHQQPHAKSLAGRSRREGNSAPALDIRRIVRMSEDDDDIFPCAVAATPPSTFTQVEEEGVEDVAMPEGHELCNAASLRVLADKEQALRLLYHSYTHVAVGAEEGSRHPRQRHHQRHKLRFEDLQALLVDLGVVPRLTSAFHVFKLFEAVTRRDLLRGFACSLDGSSCAGGDMEAPHENVLSFFQFVEVLVRVADLVFAKQRPAGERVLALVPWLRLGEVRQLQASASSSSPSCVQQDGPVASLFGTAPLAGVPPAPAGGSSYYIV